MSRPRVFLQFLRMSAAFGMCGCLQFPYSKQAPLAQASKREQWLLSSCAGPPVICCSANLLSEFTLENLKHKGAELMVDCDLEITDHTKDSARDECLANVAKAIDALYEQWRDFLIPIESRQLRIELIDQGFVTFYNDFCACIDER